MGLYLKVGLRTIGLVRAFATGVLISAVALELTEQAYRSPAAPPAPWALPSGR